MRAHTDLPLRILLAATVVATLAGCGAGLSKVVSTVKEMESKQEQSSELASLLSGEILDEAAQQDVHLANASPVYSPPYPHRTNPFEFAIDVDLDGPKKSEDSGAELKLFGFVGNEQPRAIIHLGQSTRIMSKGERWNQIEILEISPPEVKIRASGVVRTWSLLGTEPAKK